MKYALLSIVLFCSASFYAQQDLVPYEELKKKPAYKSMEEALANPADVIRLELKGEDLYNLSPDFAKFVNLQYLDLSRNEFKDIPEVLFKLEKLQHLDLGQNKITAIPAGIAKLTNLHYLCLNRNKLYVIDPAIGNLKKLADFDLYDNPIKNFPDEMGNMSGLKDLDLRMIELTDQEKQKLQRQFRLAKIRFSRTCNCN